MLVSQKKQFKKKSKYFQPTFKQKIVFKQYLKLTKEIIIENCLKQINCFFFFVFLQPCPYFY